MNTDIPPAPVSDLGSPESISSTSSPSSRRKSMSRMNLLPEGFEPGEYDVICGRGKKCYSHIGNDKFRKRVMGMLDEYSKARSKLDKSAVLNDVVEQVRLASPRGGFVKQEESGRWYEVGDFLAREKTSQAFRDCLHESYKSSNVSKKKRRQEEQARQTDKMSRFARPDLVSMQRFPPARAYSTSGLNSQTSLDIFNQMNRLAEIREDETAFAAGPTHSFRSHHNDSASFLYDSMSGHSSGDLGQSGRHPMRSVSEMSFRSRSPAINDSGSMMDDRRGVQRSFSLPVRGDTNDPSAHVPELGLGGGLNLGCGDLVEPVQDDCNFHSSMPNMNFINNQSQNFESNSMDGMHHSLPQIEFSESHSGNNWQNVNRLQAPRRERNFHLKPNSNQDVISKDMISCLEKLNDSTIGGVQHEPSPAGQFDPIPFTPDHQQKLRLSIDRNAVMHRIQDASLMDEPIYTPTVKPPTSLEDHLDRGMFFRFEQGKGPFEFDGDDLMGQCRA